MILFTVEEEELARFMYNETQRLFKEKTRIPINMRSYDEIDTVGKLVHKELARSILKKLKS